MPQANVLPSTIRVEVVASFDDLRSTWRTLDAHGHNPFASYEWASTWWGHFGRGRPRLVVASGADGSPRAILPLYLRRVGPVRVLRFIGHGAGDRLGPSGDPTDAPLAAAALRRLLERGDRAWHVLLAERLPGDVRWADVLGARVLHRDACPVIDLDPDWEATIGRFGRRLRKEIRSKERTLQRDHHVAFRRTEDPDALDADFDRFLALHRARWPERRSSLLPRAAFHRAFAREALGRGWLELWFIEVDGTPVAARYDFAMGGQWYAYNAGRDPEWSRASVGLLLRAHTIRAAIERGATAYHLLRGDEPYKQRLATRDPGLVTVAVGRGPVGRAAVRAGVAVLATPRLRRAIGRATS